MIKNKNRLKYPTDYKSAYKDADVIFIGVGTPKKTNESTNLDYVYSVVEQIANFCEKVGANIDDVTNGIGYDNRIGNKFYVQG